MALPGGTPDIDVVIAVHSADRPIARAVRSVLDGSLGAEQGGPSVRVTVVCHDIDAATIAGCLGEAASDPRLRLREHRDGIRSPSGPFNAGLDAAEAEWIAILGSDDELEPGALASWWRRARSTNSVAVLPTIVRRDRSGRDAVVPTPQVRPGRATRLDGVRDRLAYRSAPLGLLSREFVGGLRFPSGLPQGEDVRFSAQLWYSGAPIALADHGRYIVHDDAGDRVTLAPRPMADALAFVSALLDDRWFRSQSAAVRHALAVKTLRVTVLGEFVNRPASASWSASERQALATIIEGLREAAPQAERVLAKADRRVLDAIPPHSGTSAEGLLELARRRRRFGRWSTVSTRSLRDVLRREAPLRVMLATALRSRPARMKP